MTRVALADLRSELDRRWSDLAAEKDPPPGSLLTVDIPMEVGTTALLLGLGVDGRRLLIPLSEIEMANFREDQRGASVRLRRRALASEKEEDRYAELVCLRPELNGVFTALCADLLARFEAARTDDVLRLIRNTLSEWRALFAGTGRVLTLRRLTGLFGELSVLIRLLEHSASAIDTWVGPDQNRHDFLRGNLAIEVKTTLSDEGRQVRVHGLDQMEAPQGGRLLVAFKRLESKPEGGITVPQLIQQACELGDANAILGRAKAAAGYRAEDAGLYHDVGFVIDEERWYRVDSASRS